MRRKVQAFWADESGAATIDWVVLTAATVGLGVAVMGQVRGGIENLSQDIDDFLSQDLIHTDFQYHAVLNPFGIGAPEEGG